jgi:hypothetical protein
MKNGYRKYLWMRRGYRGRATDAAGYSWKLDVGFTLNTILFTLPALPPKMDLWMNERR